MPTLRTFLSEDEEAEPLELSELPQLVNANATQLTANTVHIILLAKLLLFIFNLSFLIQSAAAN
jgi:hypothetical protein